MIDRIKRDILVIVLCFGTLLAGCAYFSPSAKQNRAEVKVEKVKDAIFTSEKEILEESKGYIYGADYALLLNPNTNKYTTVAKQMTTKAMIALGQPDLVDVLKMQAIIEGLVSTNKATIEKAKVMLEEKDGEIITLQGKISDYKEILKDKEKKFVEISRENSLMADNWNLIKRIFWWIVYGIIFFIICQVLSAILPVPYNSVFGIFNYLIGGFIRVIFKLIPKAIETAKVVSINYKTALNHVVTSVQEAKTKVGAANSATNTKSVGLSVLSDELKNNTDDTTKVLITNVKQELGYI